MAERPGRFPTALDSGLKFRLAIKVGPDTISGRTVSEYLLNIVTYVDEKGLLDALPIPFATSGDNYLIATAPKQPAGTPFVSSVRYRRNKNGDLFISTNHPRFFGLRQGARILQAVGLSATLPDDIGR